MFYHPFFFSGVSAARRGDLKQTSCAQQPEMRLNLKGPQGRGRLHRPLLPASCPTISSPGQALVPKARDPAPVWFICLSMCVITLNSVRTGRGARGVTSVSPSYSETKEHSLLICHLFTEHSQRDQHWVRPLIHSERSQ